MILHCTEGCDYKRCGWDCVNFEYNKIYGMNKELAKKKEELEKACEGLCFPI